MTQYTASSINSGLATRRTVDSGLPVPTGYLSLIPTRCHTIDTAGGWDNEWTNRTTEYRTFETEKCVSPSEVSPQTEPQRTTLSLYVVLSSSPADGSTQFVLARLLDSLPKADATSPAASVGRSLPAWSKWHMLRAKAACKELSETERMEYALLKSEADALDQFAIERQLEHSRVYRASHAKQLSAMDDVITTIRQLLSIR
jgi:hypothetical protein